MSELNPLAIFGFDDDIIVEINEFEWYDEQVFTCGGPYQNRGDFTIYPGAHGWTFEYHGGKFRAGRYEKTHECTARCKGHEDLAPAIYRTEMVVNCVKRRNKRVEIRM